MSDGEVNQAANAIIVALQAWADAAAQTMDCMASAMQPILIAFVEWYENMATELEERAQEFRARHTGLAQEFLT